MTGIPLALRQRRSALYLVAFLCLLVLGLAPQASAAGSGAFSPTSSMSVPRYYPVAAPLPDGRVLVAGGATRVSPAHRLVSLNNAEVFNPATGTFSHAGIGSMSVPRAAAAAAPLPDGRVLLAGGWDEDGRSIHPNGEVFNPTTNTFTSAGIGSMSRPRAYAAAAPLPDGRVLVAGGGGVDTGHGATRNASAEIFDPATNSFGSAGIGAMSGPRDAAAAAPLPDGRVLLAGGSAPGGCITCGDVEAPSASGEVFNPATGTFSSAGIGSLFFPRWGAAAAPLPDRRVLVAGGGRLDSPDVLLPVLLPTSSAEVFAPVSCRGKQVTIVGSDRADRITGTRRADVIMGVGGNDKLSGLAGNDLICGGAGKDTLKGGKGNDKLYGQAGKDTLKGGRGKDKLKGGASKDELAQ
jgi:Ca2+-binding RTX toxin-like protein